MGLYYPADYGPHRSPTGRSGLGPRALLCQRRALHRLPSLRPGRALELGCGSGAFLSSLQKAGWEVQGIDPSPLAAERARRLGLKITMGKVEDLPESTSPFDLIVAWMVLEHLHHPIKVLRRLRHHAKARAALVVSVPDIGALDRRIFGSYWYALQLPTHLFHFDPTTLRRTLLQGGWKAERIWHESSAGNLVGSLGHVVSALPGGRRVGRAVTESAARPGVVGRLALKPLGWALGAIGQSGRMVCWARPA
ncbi:MAG: class I SAM-dependent methyltransferase [Planctomycetes bacterium]|nr:class I SAM-dependent methyltransferase [Planctomycetota bacterium]